MFNEQVRKYDLSADEITFEKLEIYKAPNRYNKFLGTRGQ